MHYSSSNSIAAPSSISNVKVPIQTETPLNAPREGCFTVTVYAASSTIVAKSYMQAANDLGREMAGRGWIQVNGGGKGLMGHCTQGAIQAGGIVDCVILRRFVANEMPTNAFRNVEVCESMLDRRAGLYRCANAFVALPGGLGTLEELAEVVSWRQLEFHKRVVVLLNTDGFYDTLWKFMERGMDEGFIARGIRGCVKIVRTAEEAVQVIEEYRPEAIHKTASLTGKADWIPSSIETDPQGNSDVLQ